MFLSFLNTRELSNLEDLAERLARVDLSKESWDGPRMDSFLAPGYTMPLPPPAPLPSYLMSNKSEDFATFQLVHRQGKRGVVTVL